MHIIDIISDQIENFFDLLHYTTVRLLYDSGKMRWTCFKFATFSSLQLLLGLKHLMNKHKKLLIMKMFSTNHFDLRIDILN
jgi:hypothetical protein